ncbi:MAG: RtcB family protein, partial [Anaerolineae bacterium]|nr:RtcB family protein [Anaerolineae bacterium]
VGKHIPENAYEQLENAMRIPPARRGAIMPDGHKGYGVPIGAVVELENAISPGYIGYDISCMLMLTVLDISPEDFMVHREALANDLRAETAFGVGAEFTQPRQHAVMDAPAWEDTKILKTLKGKAASQLGSSGGGNHFADLVIGEVTENADWLPLAVGKKFVALMTHSGSRGTGHKLATHYVKFAENSAKSTTRRLPKGHGWLTMDSDLGQEYWHAMTLMGEYSVANHELIHQHFCERAGIGQKVQYWNRHNYAWLEGDGVIHRKGATPAETGRVGIIPGTSGTASYLVTGLGNADSLNSSSHGAGRPYSRTEAKRQHNNDGFLKHMKERDILFYGIETDETYQAYKDIETVMDVQDGVLVSRVAKLEPKVVIMGGKADDGD